MKPAQSPARRHERHPVRVSCELTISGQPTHAETLNLSPGGAAILFARPLKVGEVITVSLFLTQDGIEDPDKVSFECAASVRWSKPAGGRGHKCGLQFLSPSNDQRVVLAEFLKRSAK